ncbi:hypothetical protein ACFX2I_013131 [Malus domestica]
MVVRQGVWVVYGNVEWCMEVDGGCGKDGNWLEWMMVAAARLGNRLEWMKAAARRCMGDGGCGKVGE